MIPHSKALIPELICRWISYNQLAATAESFGRGLRLLGQEPGTSIAIYAETRAEWMMSCLGAFR